MEELYDLEKADRSKASNPFHIFRLPNGSIAGREFVPGELFLPKAEFDTLRDELTGETQQYFIRPTGFTMSLVSMKPELSVILMVKDESIYERSSERFQGNWEGSIKEFDVTPTSTEFQGFLATSLRNSAFLPAGVVALAEGLSFLHDHSPRRT